MRLENSFKNTNTQLYVLSDIVFENWKTIFVVSYELVGSFFTKKKKRFLNS